MKYINALATYILLNINTGIAKDTLNNCELMFFNNTNFINKGNIEYFKKNLSIDTIFNHKNKSIFMVLGMPNSSPRFADCCIYSNYKFTPINSPQKIDNVEILKIIKKISINFPGASDSAKIIMLLNILYSMDTDKKNNFIVYKYKDTIFGLNKFWGDTLIFEAYNKKIIPKKLLVKDKFYD